MKTDVLVIGAGGAGCRAAIAAHDAGARVLLLGKSLLGKAHTVMAEGGINAPLSNVDVGDNWQVFAADTIKEGLFLNDPKAVEILAKQAKPQILELENFGALFDRTKKGKIMQRAFGAHSYKRTCHIGDRTGLEIMQVLVSEVRRRNITDLNEVFVTTLFKNKGRVVGAAGVELTTGDFIVIEAKSVVLATGGFARVYKQTTNPWENVGDGHAMAFNVGAEMQDMEMVQFHPTGMVYPETAKGILVTESVRGEGGWLLNAKDQRFMKHYDAKRMELSARDIVARAIYAEVEAGRGTKKGGVWLDISHKGSSFINKKLPKMVKKFKDFANVDITKQPMEVAPTAHYTMGGVRVNPETCETSVPGLYAAGEISAGVHGANRLGGNSLVDILVFGNLCGKAAALSARKSKRLSVSERDVEKEYKRITKQPSKNGRRCSSIKPGLITLMWEHVGIVRSKKGLETALTKLKIVKEKVSNTGSSGSLKYNLEWMHYLDLLNMIPVCEGVIKSALIREESRGAHYRTDFKQTSAKWLVNILFKKSESGSVRFSKLKVPKMSDSLSNALKGLV